MSDQCQHDSFHGTCIHCDPKSPMNTVVVQLYKPNGKWYTEERWEIPPNAVGPWDMLSSPDYRRISDGPIVVEAQEPWGYPWMSPSPSDSPDPRATWGEHHALEAYKSLRAANPHLPPPDYVIDGGMEILPGGRGELPKMRLTCYIAIPEDWRGYGCGCGK